MQQVAQHRSRAENGEHAGQGRRHGLGIEALVTDQPHEGGGVAAQGEQRTGTIDHGVEQMVDRGDQARLVHDPGSGTGSRVQQSGDQGDEVAVGESCGDRSDQADAITRVRAGHAERVESVAAGITPGHEPGDQGARCSGIRPTGPRHHDETRPQRCVGDPLAVHEPWMTTDQPFEPDDRPSRVMRVEDRLDHACGPTGGGRWRRPGRGGSVAQRLADAALGSPGERRGRHQVVDGRQQRCAQALGGCPEGVDRRPGLGVR